MTNINSLPRKPTQGTTLGRGDLTLDAWGRPKTVTDRSLLHGMFTYNIPSAMWKETLNGTELTAFSNATSVNGKLHLAAGPSLNDNTILDSFRHPRYEPNRGHLYSSSIFLPNPEAAGERDFGIFTIEAGAFFRRKADGLYAVIRTTVNTVTTDREELITNLPATYDPAKGNVYDIQMQWRGVGAVWFYMGEPELTVPKLAHRMDLLNTLTELNIYNPAMPIAYSSTNLGDNVVIEGGCVDVTSEGGALSDNTYGSISTETLTGSVAITGYDQLVQAVAVNPAFNGKHNTRDTTMLQAHAFSDQRSIVKVWRTRDSTALSLGTQTWDLYGDGNLEYLNVDPGAGTPATVDTSKLTLVGTFRVPLDSTLTIDFVKPSVRPLVITAGDYLVFTMHRENGVAANVGMTFEFGEAI